MRTQTHWTVGSTLPAFESLREPMNVDVAIIGGGSTGLTAALLLGQAGHSVAVFERGRCCRGDTAHTTAHLTYLTDKRPGDLASHFGDHAARAVLEAGASAILQIHEIVEAESIDCGFRWLPGFLHAPINSNEARESEALQHDIHTLRRLGFDADYIEQTPLMQQPGLRIPNQATFHPLRYLAGILDALRRAQIPVFEHSEVNAFENDNTLTINDQRVTAKFVFIATHVPLQGSLSTIPAMLFQTKLAPYTSYVIGGRTERGRMPDALFWDTADPYRYLRMHPDIDSDYVIYGGCDHKTGQVENTEKPFLDLADAMVDLIPSIRITDRWMGQVIETHDGLPYIGEAAENQFIATGFCGNGMTFGTLAGMMAQDAFAGKKDNPWRELFDPHRKDVWSGFTYLRENLDFPVHYLKDRLAPAPNDLESIKPGHGQVMRIDGQRVAVYRDTRGGITQCSPYCTHLGCIVHWNDADKTWDCPCHGSRFSPTGAVAAGPAETPLEPMHASKH